jgi:Icc protein
MKPITRRGFLAEGARLVAGGSVVSALAGCQAPLTAGRAGAVSGDTLRFIHITDSHMDFAGPHTLTWMERFVRTVNKDFKAIDFVLIGGDNFNNNVPGNADAVRFKKFIDALHCPAYSVRGNKESTPKPKSDPIDQRQFAGMFFRPDLTVVGRDWKLEKGRYVVLGIDTTIEQKDNGRFSAESLAFVERELKSNADKHYILLNHHVYSNFWNSTDKKDIHKYVLNNVQEVKNRLFKYANLRLALCGHKHRDNAGRIGSAMVIATPGFIVPWGAKLDRRRFRYVEIQDGRIHQRLINMA